MPIPPDIKAAMTALEIERDRRRMNDYHVIRARSLADATRSITSFSKREVALRQLANQAAQLDLLADISEAITRLTDKVDPSPVEFPKF